jgi:hypothetical protein
VPAEPRRVVAGQAVEGVAFGHDGLGSFVLDRGVGERPLPATGEDRPAADATGSGEPEPALSGGPVTRPTGA